MSRSLLGPLRGVRSIDDADADWRATLTCGHVVLRAKGRGRLTVFSRCHCRDCLQPPGGVS